MSFVAISVSHPHRLAFGGEILGVRYTTGLNDTSGVEAGS